MANYYAASRTSYVKVKDEDVFGDWADTIPDCEVITKNDKEHGTLYGFLFGVSGDSGGLPTVRYADDDDYDLDILEEIQGHIADGWAITFVEAGAEKLRYLNGWAAVVTSREIKTYNLDRWVSDTMKELGTPLSTRAEY